jgi:16S rRNA (guanine527-N7)-methyltransferase
MEQEMRQDLNVSRETMQRLEIFEALLQKWNPSINLVSRRSLKHLWSRHILDSVQVFRNRAAGPEWVDIGSGGGFPGLIVAILAKEQAPEVKVTLVESDRRKAVFLRTVVRELVLDCGIIAERIEAVPPMQADILTARALAGLPVLLGFAERHLKPDGVALFPKGVTWKKEVAEARRQWRFEVGSIMSLTEPGAAILKIEGVSRV